MSLTFTAAAYVTSSPWTTSLCRTLREFLSYTDETSEYHGFIVDTLVPLSEVLIEQVRSTMDDLMYIPNA